MIPPKTIPRAVSIILLSNRLVIIYKTKATIEIGVRYFKEVSMIKSAKLIDTLKNFLA